MPRLFAQNPPFLKCRVSYSLGTFGKLAQRQTLSPTQNCLLFVTRTSGLETLLTEFIFPMGQSVSANDKSCMCEVSDTKCPPLRVNMRRFVPHTTGG